MAYTIDGFISPLGMIVIDILDGGEEPVLTLTTEILTGHVAVYHCDQAWRIKANPGWALSEKMQALIYLIQEADLPEDLRQVGIAASRVSASYPCFERVNAAA